MAHIGVVTIQPFRLLHVGVDDGGVFTMRHDGQRCCSGEDCLQRFLTVDQHVACAAAHKQFDARNAVNIQLSEQMDIVVGGSEEETVVDMAASLAQCELLFQRLQRCGLRNSVRHIKERGDTTVGGSTALALDIGLVGKARLTEMDMGIDDARQNKTPRGIYFMVEMLMGCMGVCYDIGDAVVANDNGTLRRASFVDDRSVRYKCLQLALD